jgi:hypothetical protein
VEALLAVVLHRVEADSNPDSRPQTAIAHHHLIVRIR